MIGGITWDLFTKRKSIPTLPFVPRKFSSVAETGDWLVYHWYGCTYAISFEKKYFSNLDFPTRFDTWQRNSIAIVEERSQRLNELVDSRGKDISPKERIGVAILRIQSLMGFTSLRFKRGAEDDQTRWDEFCPVFEEAVTLAEDVVRDEAGAPYFCLDLEL